MFVSKTVFVLGAGASAEVGLPVGSRLAEIISKKVDIQFQDNGEPSNSGGDFALYAVIKAKLGAGYQQAGWMIRDGILLANSIDDFLDRHAKNEKVVRYGKLAIVTSILEAERSCNIFTSPARPRNDLFIENTVATWYARLLRNLGTGVNVESVDRLFENVAFIDFNYDRCLPQYLIEALQPLYGLDEGRAREIVGSAKILHPYGSLGDLSGDGAVVFGDPDRRADLIAVADRIRLYTEQVQEHDDIEEIKNVVGEASRVVFLGFGYHKQNLAIITPKQSSVTEILGTAYGISKEDCSVLQDWLRPILGNRANRVPRIDRTYRDDIKLGAELKAVDLFDRFSRTLLS
jgi:hypothetical protein